MKLIYKIYIFAFAVVAIATIVQMVFGDSSSSLLFNILRFLITVVLGWQVAKHNGSYSKCFLAGVLLLFSSILVSTVVALFQSWGWEAIAGLYISFIMFFWVSGTISVLSGLAHNKLSKRDAVTGTPS